jgi:hypothetical protein
MRIYTLLLAFCLTPALGAEPVIHPATEPDPRCFEFDKGVVSLTGTLFTRVYFGSPNYGENPKTDGRDTAALLLLDAPICVHENKETYAQAEFNVVLVQLAAVSVPPATVFDAVGHRVEVRGSLFHSLTGHHRTPVLMEVGSVKILN